MCYFFSVTCKWKKKPCWTILHWLHLPTISIYWIFISWVKILSTFKHCCPTLTLHVYRTTCFCIFCSVKQFFAVVSKLDVNIDAISTKVNSVLARLEKKYDVTLALYQRFEKWVQMWTLNRSLSHSEMFGVDLWLFFLSLFFQNMPKYICFGFWWPVSSKVFLKTTIFLFSLIVSYFNFIGCTIFFSCHEENYCASFLLMVWCLFPQGERDNTELLDAVSFGQG